MRAQEFLREIADVFSIYEDRTFLRIEKTQKQVRKGRLTCP